jgi:hypothetical protein
MTMAHFAQLDENNIVKQVIVVNNNELLDDAGDESEQKGIDFCTDLLGGRWVQTSYNGRLRKNFAGQEYFYDPIRDAFIAPSPFASWVLNEQTCHWEPPVPAPIDDNLYDWNEELQQWEKVND